VRYDESNHVVVHRGHEADERSSETREQANTENETNGQSSIRDAIVWAVLLPRW